MDVAQYLRAVESAHLNNEYGFLTEVSGLMLKGYLPGSRIGSLVEITAFDQSQKFLAEVVGFQNQTVMMIPLENVYNISHGCQIKLLESDVYVDVSLDMMGKVLSPTGKILNGDSANIQGKSQKWLLYGSSCNPLQRQIIGDRLETGIRVIDALMTLGRGQRIAIMAGSGVGKSMLLAQIARASSADVNVIALIGERGREVREFIENELGEEGFSKSVVVVATSDQSPLLRMRGAFYASAIAEFFSSQGKHVLLMMDSITRFAMAQREIGLSLGEPPTTKGYTPSVLSLLPKLLERAGNFEQGSITGLYTVLTEGDDVNDPIADTVRSIVDGHIVLSRSLANRAHFPAIDVLSSSSRVMKNVVNREHLNKANQFKAALSLYQSYEDLIQIGAYKRGQNHRLDQIIDHYAQIEQFLKQGFDENAHYSDSLNQLDHILSLLE
ncbi:MAG: FliI/YscN family ATPase [Bdellovibrionaceae bacterium]|nr:FliI/YscN family ATPase [Pseudobdellovibrionaceae bacterium]MDW8189963.1 FliI/YscN family ATPase [Pseudobdellovibrionaceae bacterium]